MSHGLNQQIPHEEGVKLFDRHCHLNMSDPGDGQIPLSAALADRISAIHLNLLNTSQTVVAFGHVRLCRSIFRMVNSKKINSAGQVLKLNHRQAMEASTALVGLTVKERPRKHVEN